jgi:hypothetical protein
LTWGCYGGACLFGLGLIRRDFGATQNEKPRKNPATSSTYPPPINQHHALNAHRRKGITRKIADPTECEAAGGHFLKQAFGWMVHVYPFNGDDLKVAYGMSVPQPPAN